MKTKVLAMGAVLTVILAGAAFANENFNVDEKIQHMKTQLNLTDDQARAIKPIIQDYKNKLDQASDEKEKRLNTVLSSDQMKRMKDMKNEMRKDKHKMY